MARFLLGRLGWGVCTLLVVSALVFVGTAALSGNAAAMILGKQATPERVAALSEQLGLDDPVPVRYANWLGDLVRGDLGHSLSVGTGGNAPEGGDVALGVPVSELVGTRIVNSMLLALAAAAIVFPLSIVLGVISATRPGGVVDTFLSTTTMIGTALPEFVVGLVLIYVFAIQLDLLPALSLIPPGTPVTSRIEVLVLPVATLTIAAVGHTTRMLRGSLIDVLDSDYVQMARLKGVRERTVQVRHALRNALVPTVQVVALNFAWLVGGIVVVEVVFNYPGIGQALASGVQSRDIPTVQVLALLIAAVYVVVNVIADALTVVLTPKLRTQL